MNNARNMIHMPELSTVPIRDAASVSHFWTPEYFLTVIFLSLSCGLPPLWILSADVSSLTTITATAHISAVLPPAIRIYSSGATAALRPGSRLIAGKVLDEHGDGLCQSGTERYFMDH